jgi:hypothetical protein
MPRRWLVAVLIVGVFAMTPTLWPVHGLGAFFASVVLRVGVSAVLFYFIVRMFRRNGLRGPHFR